MKNIYRIKEHCGEFVIEIYTYKTVGFFRKRKKWDWCTTNAWGGEWKSKPIYQPFSKIFKSLEKAQQQVKDWNSETIYHVV